MSQQQPSPAEKSVTKHPLTQQSLYQIKITAEKPLGAAILVVLENSFPEPLTVSHYEEDDKSWSVAAIYDHRIEPDILRHLINTNLDTENQDYQLDQLPIKDIDWVAHVQSELKPVIAGRFFIHGSHDREKAKGQPSAIEIDAAQAFGTAHHGTTEGCLTAIDKLAFTGLTPTNILDLGTGSGILAIAASMVWPEAKILASDIDPIAIDIAITNIELNNQSTIRTRCADGVDDEVITAAAPYDLLIANILAKPLIELAPVIEPLLKPEGTLLLSGILETQAEDVETAYCKQGLTHQRTDHFDEWVTILFTKAQ